MSYGGQRRTVIFPCGKQFKGALREMTKRTELHGRLCDECKEIEDRDIFKPSAFNKEMANKNGFNGVTTTGTHGGLSPTKTFTVHARSSNETKVLNNVPSLDVWNAVQDSQ